MKHLRFQLLLVLVTAVMFLAALWANEQLFRRFEYVEGINWVYLPAGIRLLSTLLFAEAGAVGLLLVSSGVAYFYMFPNDHVRALMGGVLASAAPYGVYLVAQRWMGLRRSLNNLTPARLLLCALAYSIASPLLHHIWFYLHGDTRHLADGFVAMFVGDLVGTLIVLYTGKGVLAIHAWWTARTPVPA